MANTEGTLADMSSDGEMNMKQERESSGASDTTTVAEPTAAPPAENKPPAPVEGGYGWVCVFGVFLINAHTWGLNSVGFDSQVSNNIAHNFAGLRYILGLLPRKQHFP